jgi:hypothetical protein
MVARGSPIGHLLRGTPQYVNLHSALLQRRRAVIRPIVDGGGRGGTVVDVRARAGPRETF